MFIKIESLTYTLKVVISYIESVVEDHGMDGDIETADHFVKELEHYTCILDEVSEWRNIEVVSLSEIVKKHLPELDVNNLVSWIQSVQRIKEHAIEELTKEIDMYEQVKGSLLG